MKSKQCSERRHKGNNLSTRDQVIMNWINVCLWVGVVCGVYGICVCVCVCGLAVQLRGNEGRYLEVVENSSEDKFNLEVIF